MARIKSKKEIEALREGGKILAEVMAGLEQEVIAGKSAKKLDDLARKLIRERGGRPSFLGFRSGAEKPFPFAICFSRNNEVVHGAADKGKIIAEGDLIKIDIGMEYKKMFTDMARTFAVGEISEKAKKLSEATQKSLDIGIGKIKAGARLSAYSKVVQQFIEQRGFSVIRALVGHGVGHAVHEDPQIPNYFEKKFRDVLLKPGMVLALEPMVNEGDCQIFLDRDGWTFKTSDGKLSAHFEDTVLVTETGAEILTRLS